jgi:hypothetical protein
MGFTGKSPTDDAFFGSINNELADKGFPGQFH